MQFDWSAIWPAIPLLIEGAKMTLWISVPVSYTHLTLPTT